jgi:hypothetical protein
VISAVRGKIFKQRRKGHGLDNSKKILTDDGYLGHLVPGSNRSAVDKLDDFSMQPDATQAGPEKKGAGHNSQPLEILW